MSLFPKSILCFNNFSFKCITQTVFIYNENILCSIQLDNTLLLKIKLKRSLILVLTK